MGTVTLREDGDFLLNVLNLILCFFKVNNLHGDYLLRAVVNPVMEGAEGQGERWREGGRESEREGGRQGEKEEGKEEW